MKTLVCLILLAAVAVILLPSPKPAEPERAVVAGPAPTAAPRVPLSPPAMVPAPVPAMASATPAAPQGRVWARDELFVLHGQIIKSVAGGTLIECTAPEAAHTHTESVAESDRRKYGSLMICDNGQWRPCEWSPDTAVDGTVVLAGPLPMGVIKPDSVINIIVAKVDQNTYTTNYTARASKAGVWMWKSHNNPLDQMPNKP